MKIFITGANGQLSKSLSELFEKDGLYLATRDRLDVTDKKEVLKKISDYNPDFIFHLASMTRGDECAKNPEKAFKVNVEGTRNVIEACLKSNSTLVFVSTNEVFDGKKKVPYKEKDRPNPITVVGKTKFEAEKIIKTKLRKYYIVRTSWLYSQWSSNFLHAVLNKARKDKRIELVSDEVSSPTSSADLSSAIKKLIATNLYGTYHIVNTGSSSRLEFAKEAFKIYGLKDVEIIPLMLKDYNRLSKPPLFTALDNTKIKDLGIKLPKWQTSLKNFLNENQI